MKLMVKVSRGFKVLRQEIIPLIKCFGVYLGYTWFGFKKLSHEQFVDKIDRILGSRNPLSEFDKKNIAMFLSEKNISHYDWISSCFRLPSYLFPFVNKYPINEAHHKARETMIQHHLPKASFILDLGGASDHAQEGALLSMGYPHRPKQVCIVDQPYDRREHYNIKIKQPDSLLYKETQVSYFYTLMSDLKNIPSKSYDMIWCGQSIEHITFEEAKQLFREAKRILTKDGYFCLDTPNNLMARLISPYAYLHPEHKIEYNPSQLVEELKICGYTIHKVCAISAMPISARIKRFCRLELIEGVAVNEDYNSGYSFYIEAQICS
jgi:hypothetical protein